MYHLYKLTLRVFLFGNILLVRPQLVLFCVMLHRWILYMLLGCVLGLFDMWIGPVTGETLANVLEI